MPEEHDHIVSRFDEDLNQLDNLLAEMGGLAEHQFADAIKALVRRDSELAEQVIVSDKRIDAIEESVDQHTISMLALRQPMADDLRVVITALRIASVIERIGDYSKNIAKRTVAITQTPPVGPSRTISRMGNVVQGMIKTVLDAYLQRDAELAQDVRMRDEEVDALHTSLFRELLTYMMEDPRSISACAHLLFVAKNIERIGDHATNIAEHVYFLVHGSLPEDTRPKDDQSSYTVIGGED
ncbi:phosphate signaling complex protein PhoU [Thalassospiraceae bacterium LMO-JJ14]|nr:phosphate signaling complex protein PhoU [Thalassospiraceae bacterium LMO-JJ14]